MKQTPLALLAVGIMLVLSACSSGSNTPEPKLLTVTPLSGPPGTVLTIAGLQLTPEQSDNLELWVGNQPAPVILNEDSSLSSAIPLFPGPGDWPVPPSGPQVVEVRRANQVLGRAEPGVTVTELPEAPGSTEAVYAALLDITSAYDQLWAALPTPHPEEAALWEAVSAMLHELLTEGENSLQAVLAGTAPILEGNAVDVRLLDAVLASSGAKDYLIAYAEAFTFASTEAGLHAQALYEPCDGTGDDVDLACKMQIFIVLDEYSRSVVKPSAATYANTVGVALATVGIFGGNGVVLSANAIIGALLGIADLIMEKVAPALFPSRISKFELHLIPHVRVGEQTDSMILITAENKPIPITYLDLVEQAYAMWGLKGLNDSGFKAFETFKEHMKAYAWFVVEAYVKVAKSTEGKKPGTHPWVSAGDIKIPKMTWGPLEITDPRLVQLFSYDTSIAEALEEEMEWKGVAIGDTTIRVMPRGPGSKSKILKDHALCIGCIYYGGAFGSEMPAAQSPLSVGNFAFKAVPSEGTAPFTTTFSWEGLPTDAEPFTCVLDPGDGTTPITISDCANTSSHQHTYSYSSTFATSSGQYRASLQVLEMPLIRELDVNVEWHFIATPTQGQAPLNATFNWSGFDPAGGAISCTLDFGDGSPAQTFSDCHSTKTATHQYTSKGSYVPSLTVTGVAGQTVKTAQVSVGQQLCPPNPDTSQRCIGEAQYVQTERWYSGATTNDARDTWTFSNIEFVYDEVNSTSSASYFYVAKATLVNYERWHKTYDQINGETCETYETASGIPLVNVNDSIEYAIQDTPVGGWLVVLHEEADGFPAGSYAGNAGAMFEAKYERTCTDASRNVTKQVTGGAEMFLIPGPENYGPGDPPEPYVVQEGGVLAGSYTFGGDDGFGGSSSGEFSWHFVIPDLH